MSKITSKNIIFSKSVYAFRTLKSFVLAFFSKKIFLINSKSRIRAMHVAFENAQARPQRTKTRKVIPFFR